MASSGSSPWSEQLEWVKEGGSHILKKPCVRNALMAGIATGTMMGIHKFRMGSEYTPLLLLFVLHLFTRMRVSLGQSIGRRRVHVARVGCLPERR